MDWVCLRNQLRGSRLKFRAPGTALPIGMNIGRLAFKALNKIEWVCAVTVIVSAIINHSAFLAPENIYMLVVLAVLAAQTFWLLPKRDARADRYISAQSRPPTNLHIYFIAAEVLKVVCLGAAGVSMFNAG